MRYQIVGLNYGCEVDPVLAMLRVTFPEITFSVETTLEGTFTCSQAIFATGEFDARELDHMRITGAAFRSGFQKGYMVGFHDRKGES